MAPGMAPITASAQAMAQAPHGCLPTLAPAKALAPHGCLPTLHGNGEHPPTPAPAMALGMALSLRGLFRTLAPAMEPAVALQHEGERTRRRFRVLRRAKAKDRHRLLPRGGGGRLLLLSHRRLERLVSGTALDTP